MIRAIFTKKCIRFAGYEITGHSGYGEAGSDIVCASVSSAAMLVANLLTEKFGVDASVESGDNFVRVQTQGGKTEDLIIGALFDHIEYISQSYKKTINLIIKED